MQYIICYLNISLDVSFEGLGFNCMDSGGIVAESYTNINISSSYFRLCKNDKGGAVNIINANLNINNSTFSSCVSSSAEGGGAIFADSSILNIKNSIFSGNIAQSGSGGSILYQNTNNYFNSSLKIVETSFISNTAINGNGGSVSVTGPLVNYLFESLNFDSNVALGGGSIYFSKMNNLEISNSIFVSSIASNNNGGGIFIESDVTGDIIFNSLSFKNNLAYGSGGSIYSTGSNSVKLNKSFFSKNICGSHAKLGFGGSVFLGNIEAVIINDSTFYHSLANSGGAVSINFGIYAYLSYLQQQYVHIYSNLFYFQYTIVSTVVIKNSYFNYNSAVAYFGNNNNT